MKMNFFEQTDKGYIDAHRDINIRQNTKTRESMNIENACSCFTHTHNMTNISFILWFSTPTVKGHLTHMNFQGGDHSVIIYMNLCSFI